MALTFTSEENALYFLEDIMGRCQIPFVLLGETAREVYHNLDADLNNPKIEAGVKQKDLTESGFKTLKMFLPPKTEITDKSIKFTQKDTEVEIKIIKKKWKFLENPDTIFYRLAEFRIPNPFTKYWKVRGLL